VSGVQLLILAVIQGLTELLPVSSSAHVILAERLMGLDPAAPDLTFLLVMLHTGTMLAVLAYFGPRWRRRWRAEPTSPRSVGVLAFGWLTLVATVCTGVLGLLLKVVLERWMGAGAVGQTRGEVEALFRNLPLIGGALLGVGVLILAAGARETASPARSGLTLGRAVVIGTVQALALPFRGFSRSGATISTALLAGVDRQLAEEFSFALAVWLTPPVVAIELRRLLRTTDFHGTALVGLLGPGLMGMGASFLAGLVALCWLSAWLARGQWGRFAYYCLVLAGIVWVGHRFGW
jgi:undecaprenyl-diphosphatase